MGIGDGNETEKGNSAGFISAVKDWKVWWLALALTSMVVSLSFNAFFPTLSATLGRYRSYIYIFEWGTDLTQATIEP